MFSPRNIASMRSRSPDSSGKLKQQPQGFVGDPVLRIVEIDPGALRRHPLPAIGILGEKLPEVDVFIVP